LCDIACFILKSCKKRTVLAHDLTRFVERPAMAYFFGALCILHHNNINSIYTHILFCAPTTSKIKLLIVLHLSLLLLLLLLLFITPKQHTVDNTYS